MDKQIKQPYCEKEFRGINYDCFVVPAMDGTPLAVKRTGPVGNPPMLIANGVGVPWFGMHPIIEELSRNFNVYTWDYRGVGESEPVVNKDFTMERHAHDGLRVMEWFELDKVGVVGWSMGVPVLIEMFRKNPEKFDKMAFLFGAPGLPYVASIGKTGDFLFRKLLSTTLNHMLFPILLKKFLDSHINGFVKFLATTGFTSNRTDIEIITKNVKAVIDDNTLHYGTTLIELGKHNGWDVLPQINCPTFIAGGGKDWVTPESTMEKMASMINNSIYYSFPDASHFGVIEERDSLLSPLGKFFL